MKLVLEWKDERRRFPSGIGENITISEKSRTTDFHWRNWILEYGKKWKLLALRVPIFSANILETYSTETLHETISNTNKQQTPVVNYLRVKAPSFNKTYFLWCLLFPMESLGMPCGYFTLFHKIISRDFRELTKPEMVTVNPVRNRNWWNKRKTGKMDVVVNFWGFFF